MPAIFKTGVDISGPARLRVPIQDASTQSTLSTDSRLLYAPDGSTIAARWDNGFSAPYKANIQSANYTLVFADAGGMILHPSADTTIRTFTIPSNASVAFPIGTKVTFVNQSSAGTVTLAITTDTLSWVGLVGSGNWKLVANMQAVATKITATEWQLTVFAGSIWRSGVGAPSDSLGSESDFYVNSANGNIYRQTAGTYSQVGNIRGIAGVQMGFSTATTGIPAVGLCRFDSSDLTLISLFAISRTDAFSNNINSLLNTWDDSNSTGTKGYLILTALSNNEVWTLALSGNLSAYTDYLTFPAVQITGSSVPPTNGEILSIAFQAVGDVGATGPTGPNSIAYAIALG